MTESKAKLEELSAERCAGIAQSLRLSTAHFNLKLNPSSPLARVTRDLEWMGSFSAGPMVPGGAGGADRKRVVEVIPRVEQAERIATALERVRGVPGAARVAACLGENIDRLTTLHERGQDLLFEIEVGGRLAGHGLPVAFAEPDILLNFNREPLGLPCKRPRSARGVVGCIKDGIDQLAAADLPGIPVLSLEPIVHPPAPRGGLSAKKPAPVNWTAKSAEEADAASDRMVKEALETALPEIYKLFAKHRRIAGVLFCGVITAWLESPSAYVWRWLSYPVPSPADPQSPSLTELLGYLVRGGGEE